MPGVPSPLPLAVRAPEPPPERAASGGAKVGRARPAGLDLGTRPWSMRWLYRLQARLGLSGPEGAAALAVLLALAGGTVAQHLQATSEPVPADVYAAADAAFAATASDAGAPDVPLALGPVAPAADSTAAQVAEAAVETAAAPRRSAKAPPVATNLNTASAEQLQRLPGIGPALAARVVEYRRAHGPFRHPDEIVQVKGIGEKKLEALRPWVHL